MMRKLPQILSGFCFLAATFISTSCKKDIFPNTEDVSMEVKINHKSSAFVNADFLKTSGQVIRNNSGTGKIINLRGTNLGSWLSQEYWIGPLGTPALNRSLWTATASSTFAGVTTSAVFDNNLSTRWSNGTAQVASGQWFKIDMGKQEVFNQVTFDVGTFTSDYARGYLVQLSSDGINWTNVGSGTGSNVISVNFGATKARYVLIYQTGSASASYWSIAEFNAIMCDDFSLRNQFVTRFGETGADNLLNTFQNTWIQSSDLDKIKTMGMNMVRVPVFWKEIMKDDGTIKPGAFTQLDWLATQCALRNIYMIIDLHGAPGGSDGYITSGQAVSNEVWTNSTYQTMTINLWKAIAAHYNGNPTVAAYDLLNEPVSSSSTLTIKAFYNTLYNAVRSVDANHIICMQAFYDFDTLGSPSSNGWTNVIYQGHYYNTDTTNYASQSGFIDWALGDLDSHKNMWNVPVYAGEYNFWNFTDLWAKWLSGLNSHNISWSNWTYKITATGNNWGFYQGNSNPTPDMNNDSQATITAKWNMFTTANFTANTTLINLVSQYTTAPPAP